MEIVYPISPHFITQKFGVNPNVYKKFGLKGHNGIDIRTKYPDSLDGKRPMAASWLSDFLLKGNDPKGYGVNFEVIVKLKRDWKLTYAHCEFVVPFKTAQWGEQMAVSDNTGFSTAAHVHLTTKPGKWDGKVFIHEDYNNGYKGAVDPQQFFDELGAIMEDDMPQWLNGLLQENGISLDSAEGRIREIFDQSKRYELAQKERDKALRDLAEARGDATKFEENYITAQKENKRLADEIDELKRSVASRDTQVTALEARVLTLEGQLNPEKVLVITREEYARLTAKKQLDKFTKWELVQEIVKRFIVWKRGDK